MQYSCITELQNDVPISVVIIFQFWDAPIGLISEIDNIIRH